jgi:hypothetical protein
MPRPARASGAGCSIQLCALAGYNRSYAARLLRARARGPAPPKRRRVRPHTYTAELLVPLRKIWAVLDRPCGKRLAAVMVPTIEALGRHGELELSDAQRELLSSVSAATLDRLLAPERARLRLRGRAMTKPGTLLKSAIPVRTFSEWDHGKAGFLEIDLVSHEGGDPRGPVRLQPLLHGCGQRLDGAPGGAQPGQLLRPSRP